MRCADEQLLLRVYLRNTDHWGRFSAAETLVERALALRVAGATVLRGVVGLDGRGGLLESRWWSLVEHVPVIVQLVDEPEVIGEFLYVLEEMLPEGLATLQGVQVVLHGRRPAAVGGMEDRLEGPEAPDLFCEPTLNDWLRSVPLGEEGWLLRVFVGEAARWEGEPLYRAIVLKAQELGLAGVAVFRGPMGFGASGRLRGASFLRRPPDLPVIVEAVDAPANIRSLLPFLDAAVAEGLATLEEVRMLRYYPQPIAGIFRGER
jgi:PII-like signaling protein